MSILEKIKGIPQAFSNIVNGILNVVAALQWIKQNWMMILLGLFVIVVVIGFIVSVIKGENQQAVTKLIGIAIIGFLIFIAYRQTVLEDKIDTLETSSFVIEDWEETDGFSLDSNDSSSAYAHQFSSLEEMDFNELINFFKSQIERGEDLLEKIID